MLTVWKYPVPVEDEFELAIPVPARPLTVQIQDGMPYLWALVDPDPNRLLARRRFRLAGTGHPIEEQNDELQYIGTFQMHGDALVFHVFWVRSASGEA